MKSRYQNAFFIFGIVVLAVMLSQLDYAEVWEGLRHAGYWFLAVVLLWLFLYMFNATSWYIIIRSGLKNQPNATENTPAPRRFSFAWLYKVTVSGFALNYATPGGLMGGEPYRIMALTPYIGVERAASSVVLYAMTHIFSHFWFWLLSVVLYLVTQTLTPLMSVMLSVVGAFCLLAIWFFLSGYKKGLAVRCLSLLQHVPGVKKWAIRFVNSHQEQLANIDKQIAALHNQNPRTFVTVVLLELACRVCSALEVMFILLVLFPSVQFVDCILVIAFTTLFANMLFFMPLQLGGREGGFMMSVSALGLTTNAGIFVALLVRLRELIWTAIGLLLIKMERKKK